MPDLTPAAPSTVIRTRTRRTRDSGRASLTLAIREGLLHVTVRGLGVDQPIILDRDAALQLAHYIADHGQELTA
ncbi:hypothetical protein [Tsukamurella tyrosinosolvens]|uniref:hypothetical protein n=1 Tax=Tsukamurella tyrosinosolvens TaxID=57704 RepID=UPI0007B2AE53|nr:hypothetical protein [Tsukamurella tyrosinosolvens]KZL97731.1 hypothetical protein AXX05_01950 [Tsukamurella tyrosinosolvens]